MAAAKHIELPAVSVPPHLWTRSQRPAQGRIVQFVVPGALIVAGLLLPGGTGLRVALVLAGLILFFALPAMVIARLERIGREVQAADARTAAELLHSLPNKPVVQFFAPGAWKTLQEGILQLKTGAGKAAAANFVETARLVGQPEAVMLVSAQAHALVVAGERAEARELLQKLAKENLLGSRDQLDLGIVLLVESQKKNKTALAYIEAARKTIGDHPRVLAALALALQKTERIDEASELLEQVQISVQGQGGEADPVVEDLVKRARKGLQAFIEAQLRRERRSRQRRTTIVVSSDLAASEIVSGEIGAGDQAQLDNPTTSFRPAETVISSKSVDGELTEEERSMLNLPDSRIRKAEEAKATAFSIDSIEEEEEEDAPVAPTPSEPSAPITIDSGLLRVISAEPVAPKAPASLINPATAAPPPPPKDPEKILPPLPFEFEPTPAPKVEVDVPVFRRKQTQTYTSLPAVPDRPNLLGSLPTGGNPSSSAPPLSSLPVAGGAKSAMPTRRPELPTSSAPKTTTPLFRAPIVGKADDKPESDG